MAQFATRSRTDAVEVIDSRPTTTTTHDSRLRLTTTTQITTLEVTSNGRGSPPIEVENVRDEERLFGGDVVWWALLLVVSVPIVLCGLALAPQIHRLSDPVGGRHGGRDCLCSGHRCACRTSPAASCSACSSSFVASVIIGGIGQLYIMTLPVPQASLDVMYKPPISGG